MLVENRGQFRTGTRYRTVFGSPAVAVTDDGIVVSQLAQGEDGAVARGHNVRLRFGSTNPATRAPRLVAGEPAQTRASYFHGDDPDHWTAAAPCWDSVVYDHVADGVDVEVHFRRGSLEYDVIAQPGARLDELSVTIDGADGMSVYDDGRLEIRTPLGVVTQSPPVVWQTDQRGERLDLACAIVQSGPNRLGFRVPGWDGRAHLTIDPSILLSTFVEGSAGDGGSAITTDRMNASYVGGTTSSSDFPVTPGAFDVTKNSLNDDAVVFKLSPQGNDLEFATFLGGTTSSISLSAIRVDGRGFIYVTGATGAPDYPTTPGSFSPNLNGGGDSYLTKLDPSGSSLVYSTYFGGTGNENCYDAIVDASGRAIVVGDTKSFDLPTTPGAPQPRKPAPSPVGSSGFIARLSADGVSIDYCTYLGGAIGDYVTGVSLGPRGDICVSGRTSSTSTFPTTPGVVQELPKGLSDSFACKYTEQGSLEWATLLGGSDVEYSDGVAVDAEGNVYVTGYTYSFDFPTTPGAFDETFDGDADIYVSKLAPDGASLVYSTRLGGLDWDLPYGIALGSDGSCYVVSQTASSNFPVTPDALDPTLEHAGSFDPHLARLSADGSTLLYGTFFGGPTKTTEIGYALAVDASGIVHVAGYTLDPLFPTTPGALDSTLDGPNGLFVMRFDLGPWTDLGHGLAGFGGTAPVLSSEAALQPGSAGSIDLAGARPSSLAFFALGLDEIDAPFKFGTFVPEPLVLAPAVTDPQGSVSIPFASWSAGIPAGSTLCMQWWIVDPDGPFGYAASNGLLAVTPVPDGG
ncbi:MAG: SBBP repeat-containing protein [Planctomycetes bacterium]|nr:SBBP repeat-containing protein [Planctomycetota bacterium]